MNIERHTRGVVYVGEGIAGLVTVLGASALTGLPLGMLGVGFLGGRAARGMWLNRDSFVLTGLYMAVAGVAAWATGLSEYYAWGREDGTPLLALVTSLAGAGVGTFAPSWADKEEK